MRRRRRPLWCFLLAYKRRMAIVHPLTVTASQSVRHFFPPFLSSFPLSAFSRRRRRRKEAAETNGSKHIQCAAAAQKGSPESSLTAAAATAEAVKKFGAKARKKEIEKTAAPAMASHCNSLEVSK